MTDFLVGRVSLPSRQEDNSLRSDALAVLLPWLRISGRAQTPNETVVGRCSLCGGDVLAWTAPYYHSVVPPPLRCSGCGATRKNPRPLIVMEEA